jgi:hypothetical protein
MSDGASPESDPRLAYKGAGRRSYSSAWRTALDTTSGKFALAAGSIAAFLAVTDRVFGFVNKLGIKQEWPWFLIVNVLVLIAGGAVYVRELRRARSEIIPRRVTAFIGAEPFTESDTNIFFGRENEVRSILRKLGDADLRYLILYGDSGSGKTSLVRAGLIPALSSGGRLFPIYVRLFEHPDRSLREALLRSCAHKADDSPAPPDKLDAQTGHQPSLVELLQLTTSAVGRSAILFLDQFEEFFSTASPDSERSNVLEFLKRTLTSEELSGSRIVFVIRRDYFDRLSIFDSFVDDLFRQTHRYRLETFDRLRAKAIVVESLRYASSDTPAWDASLIDRVIDDLVVKRRDGDTLEPITVVIPAELQIVCHMVQSRGIAVDRDYPGKERLIRDYVSEAIQESADSLQTRRILASLVATNGITRAAPQSARELSERLQGLDERHTVKILRYLESRRLIVEVVSTEPSNGGLITIRYELAHEYLVRIIGSLTGATMDRTLQANALLHEYRTRSSLQAHVRVPFSSCRLIRKYATEELTPEDNRLLRASERRFAYQALCGIAIPVLVGLSIRGTTAHFGILFGAGGESKVVIMRGLPYLQPLLGSSRVLIDTGLTSKDISDEGRNDCLANRVTHLWSQGDAAWSSLLMKWHREFLLNSGVQSFGDLLASGANPQELLNLILTSVRDARRKGDEESHIGVQTSELTFREAIDRAVLYDFKDEQLLNEMRGFLSEAWVIQQKHQNAAHDSGYEDVADQCKTIIELSRALGHLAGVDEEIVTSLRNCLADRGEPSVPVYAVSALEELGIPLARYEDLIKAALHDGRSVQDMTEYVAKRKGLNTELTSEVIKSTQQEWMQYWALDALSEIPSTTPGPRLLEIMHTGARPELSVKAAAAFLANGGTDADADRITIAFLTSPAKFSDVLYFYTRVPQPVIRGLQARHPELASTLLNSFRQSKGRQRHAFKYALVTLKVNDEEFIGEIADDIRTGSVYGAELAAEFGSEGEPIVQALLSCIKEQGGAARLDCAAALKRLGIHEDEAARAGLDALDWVPNGYTTYAEAFLIRKDEGIDEAIGRLWPLANSEQADASAAYRGAVVVALLSLVQNGDGLPAPDGRIKKELKIRFKQWADSTLYHRRRIGYHVLALLGETPEQLRASGYEEWL